MPGDPDLDGAGAVLFGGLSVGPPPANVSLIGSETRGCILEHVRRLRSVTCSSSAS